MAGPEVYLLGSGGLLLPSLGLVDGMRSGPDVAPLWTNYATDDPSDAMAYNAVVNTLHRLWQAPLLQVDPDIVYFRSRLNLLTDTQMAWLQDLAGDLRFPGDLRPALVAEPAGAGATARLSDRAAGDRPDRPLPLHGRRPRRRLHRGAEPRPAVSDLLRGPLELRFPEA